MFVRYMNPSSTIEVATIHLFLHIIILQFVIMVLGIVVNVISEAEELVYDANEIKRVHERTAIRKFVTNVIFHSLDQPINQ
jgi:hypothetical protein